MPILVYGTDEHISINMIRRIYDHPRSRYAIDQGEIFEFACAKSKYFFFYNLIFY